MTTEPEQPPFYPPKGWGKIDGKDPFVNERAERAEAEVAALEAALTALRAIANESNAVCACGCSPADHENLGEDGESCGHDDHECYRTSATALAELTALRQQQAQPKLIIAAPDLLDACEQMLKVFTDLDTALRRATEQKAELVHVGDLYKLTKCYVPLLRGVVAKAKD